MVRWGSFLYPEDLLSALLTTICAIGGWLLWTVLVASLPLESSLFLLMEARAGNEKERGEWSQVRCLFSWVPLCEVTLDWFCRLMEVTAPLYMTLFLLSSSNRSLSSFLQVVILKALVALGYCATPYSLSTSCPHFLNNSVIKSSLNYPNE